jgi:predicted ATPase/class 3 adenylate cyclase
VRICPSCRHENADDARFCSQCATPLEEAAGTREERKVVTCLFCDLVGFTARAERLDPEEVRAVLQPYHAQVRSDLERFGGTFEKFIGDAVMAIFGAPVAHEDDPERAVRAALAIRDTLAEDELDVRIGITTGEALITLGARPEAGEGMAAGDVVNTAARLQSAAATNAILVDETTFRATERAIEYREAEQVQAKGKSEPLVVWEARAARARVGVERVGGAPLVGREQELTLLRETLARVIREREPQLVTLVGVPGIGKSRLVYELFQTIETGDFGLVFWRHGRSLPYGDGVTFWALGEMVKAQAGILESDGPEQAGEKLGQAVTRFVDDTANAAWLERQLRPLAGLETEETWAGGRREEAFAAWRHFLEAIADERPLVLVFEDLHWADDALLDFVDYLVDWARGVPLLVLGTARPELLSRQPGWGGGKANSSTILLSALSEGNTAALLRALLGSSVVDADLQARLLEHAGGNPLYAEEFTRMLTSRPGDVVLPETVQGIIAARLDTLRGEEKELLQEAAAMGRTFWLGALAGERWALEERLHSLERKEFVRRERRSAVAGETEYSFRHALVREVAYEQIPRAQRADKHRAAAVWIESLGRIEDHSELLAHHYAAALDYARASGQDTGPLAEQGRIALREAGDRAFALNAFAAAARYYELAIEPWPHDAEWPELLFKVARTYMANGDERTQQALEDTYDAALAAGRLELAAEADALLAELWWYRADSVRSAEHVERARTGVEGLPPSRWKAHVLSQVSRYRMLAGAEEEAIRIGGDVLAMAEELGLPELQAHALNNIGTARINIGDAAGLRDIERAIEIATAAGSSEVARAANNLAVSTWMLGDLRGGSRLMGDAVAHAERLGIGRLLRFSRNVHFWLRFREGDWDEALPHTEEFLAACDAGETHYHEGGMRLRRAAVRLARDDAEGALDDIRQTVPLARQAGDPQQRIPWLAGCTRLLVEAGKREEARQLAPEARPAVESAFVSWALVELAFVAQELDLAEELAEQLEHGPQTKWTAASRALLGNDFVAAADMLDEIGDAELAATARLRAVEQLLADGRRAEADEQLRRSLGFWRSVRATRYIRQAEALLAAAS